jgi:integrase
MSDGSIGRALRELLIVERDVGKPPHEVSRAEYRRWLAGFAPNSASFRLRVTRGFYAWLHREGFKDEAIAAGISIRTIEEPQRTATDQEIREMLDRSRRSPRDHAICSLFAATGARRSEVGLMTFGDLRGFIDQSLVRISRSKTQARVVPLDAVAERAVRRWLRANRDALDGDGAWHAKNGPQLVARATTRHGGLPPHAVRRWAVTRWLADGGSSASLGRMMGWSPATTNVMSSLYTKATGADLLATEYARIRR